MGSKVPKFGAWEGVQGGENFTVYFDNARKNKNNGQKINPNDPEENSDLFQPAPSQIRADEQRKTKHAGPSTAENEPRAPTQTQARPKVSVTPQEDRAKVPQFGAWNGGEGAQYTAYFDVARKTKTDGGEPMMNRDVGDRGQAPTATKARTGPPKDDGLRHPSKGSTSSVPGSGSGSGSGSEGLAKQGSVPKTPVQPRANHHGRTGGSRGNQAAGVPTFGGWNNDPSQAEGYTVAFARAKEQRNTPLNNNAPPSYHEPPPYNNQKQGGPFIIK